MVTRLRKVFESLGRNPLLRRGDSTKIKEPDEDVVETEDVRTTAITDLEELVNERTKDLAEAKEQLRHLSSAVYGAQEGKGGALVKEAMAQLLKPEGGLVLKTVKISPGEKDETPIKDTPVPPPPTAAELALETMKVSAEVKEGLRVSSAPAEEPLPTSKLPDGVKAQVVGSKTAELLPVGSLPDGVKAQGVLTAISGTEEKKPKKEGAGDVISQIFNREDEEHNPLASLLASLPEVALKDLLDEALEIKAMLGEWQQN